MFLPPNFCSFLSMRFSAISISFTTLLFALFAFFVKLLFFCPRSVRLCSSALSYIFCTRFITEFLLPCFFVCSHSISLSDSLYSSASFLSVHCSVLANVSVFRCIFATCLPSSFVRLILMPLMLWSDV